MVKPPKHCPPGFRPIPNPPRCVPMTGGPGGPIFSPPGGGLFPFNNAASVAPAPTPVPPPPVVIGCHDALTEVPFAVPWIMTVSVSGGGAALQNAVTLAPPMTRLVIQDSLGYDPITVTGKTDLTIEADLGQTPSITATLASDGHCIVLDGANSGIAIRGLTLIGIGNENVLDQTDNGLLLASAVQGTLSIDRVIVEDCTFSEPAATAPTGMPGIQLLGTDGSVHQNVWIHRCTFRNNAAGTFSQGAGYGACTVGGFTNVYIQNCQVLRDNAVIARASSNMRGFMFKDINVVIEDCLVKDTGTAGSNEAFKHVTETIFGTTAGNSSLRNCVAYNCKRWYRITQPATTMTMRNCIGDNDVVGIAAGQTLIQQTAGTLTIIDSVLTGAGDGTTFTAGVTENHNDVFNFAATGKVLDATDITVDPLYEDVANGDFLALETTCQTAASDGGLVGIRYTAGEKIIWCNH